MAAKKSKDTSPTQGKGAGSAGGSKVTDLIRYFEDSKTELGKVSWPTKQEVKATSLAVVALVVFMSIFLGLIDQVLVKVVEAILSIGA